METIFGERLRKAILTSNIDNDAENARAWLRDKASNIRSSDTSAIINRGNERAVKTAAIGQMFLFSYDAKHKDTLPYYDRFPLIFPFDIRGDGFLGINMHYLPLPLRARLMDSLYDTLNNDKLNTTTRLKISYDILTSAAKFKYFKPCIKHYLNSHVDSKLIYIDPKEWDVALFLPLQSFQKESTAVVYRDSRRIISKGK